MGVHVRLTTRELKNVVEVDWTIQNLDPEPIRVPVMIDDETQPLAFITPTGFLVLVFGSFSLGPDRSIGSTRHLECEWRWIPPGKRMRGTVSLPVPYETQHNIGNPYVIGPDQRRGVYGRRRRISEIVGVYAVVRYSKYDAYAVKRARGGFEPWEDRMYRGTVGMAMITGTMQGGLVAEVLAGLAVSRRVAVWIPMRKAVEVFVPERPKSLEFFEDEDDVPTK